MHGSTVYMCFVDLKRAYHISIHFVIDTAIIEGDWVILKVYLAPAWLKQELCKVKLVPSAGWTLPGLPLVLDPVCYVHGQDLRDVPEDIELSGGIVGFTSLLEMTGNPQN